MITITRRIPFCAGHRVLGTTKCSNLHGHNYVLHVTFSHEEGLDDKGMVIDFGEVKNRVKTWIDDCWDHAFIYWNEDKFLKNFFAEHIKLKSYELLYNPTAENMCKYVGEVVIPNLFEDLPQLKLVKVEIEETENCTASINY